MDATENPCGDLIKKTRQDRGLSIRETANRASVSEGRLRQIEKGYAQVATGVRVPARPSARLLRSIASVLDLDADDLIIKAETAGLPLEPDDRDSAHQAFVELIRADTTLDDTSKNHIIAQHELLQRVMPVAESLAKGEITKEDLDRIGKEELARARAAKQKRQTPEAQ